MDRIRQLQTRIRIWTWIFVVALVGSGLTAIPLESELNLLSRFFGGAGSPTGLGHWILTVRDGLHETNVRVPFLAYGTDWLAFGHVVIAVAFIGALRDPVRNIWLFQFGMIACALVIPWAFVFGQLRGIPMGWRLIDCSFGVLGFIPLWFCWRGARELSDLEKTISSSASS